LASFKTHFVNEPELQQSLLALRGMGGNFAAWSIGLHDPHAGKSPKLYNPFSWQPMAGVRLRELASETAKMLMPLDWSYSRHVLLFAGYTHSNSCAQQDLAGFLCGNIAVNLVA